MHISSKRLNTDELEAEGNRYTPRENRLIFSGSSGRDIYDQCVGLRPSIFGPQNDVDHSSDNGLQIRGMLEELVERPSAEASNNPQEFVSDRADKSHGLTDTSTLQAELGSNGSKNPILMKPVYETPLPLVTMPLEKNRGTPPIPIHGSPVFPATPAPDNAIFPRRSRQRPCAHRQSKDHGIEMQLRAIFETTDISDYALNSYSIRTMGCTTLGSMVEINRRSDRKVIGGTAFNITTLRLENKLEPFLASFLLFKHMIHPNIMNIRDVFSGYTDHFEWYCMWERNFFEEVTLSDVLFFNLLDEKQICYYWQQVRYLHYLCHFSLIHFQFLGCVRDEISP
jgi:hypothetical protein